MARIALPSALLLAATLLAACATPPQPPEPAPSKPAPASLPLIRGELTYRARIAPPPDSVAVVELREAQGSGPVVTDWRRTLGGAQVPVRFEMPFDPGKLQAQQRYGLRAAIFAGGQPAWASEAKPVALGNDSIVAGTILLTQFEPLAAASTLRGGVTSAPSALRARGNEPSWSLEIGATLRLRTPAATLEGPAPAAQVDGGVRRYAGTLDGRAIVVVAREQRCADTMTGMPYPLSVEMQFDGRGWRGCGGEPAALLTGKEWVIEDIAGGIIDRSRATLNFTAEGRLTGRASCNTFTAAWRLTGESLGIGRAASTMMACAPTLMQQEVRFLDILQQATRFEISDTGALVLIARDGRRIVARRPN